MTVLEISLSAAILILVIVIIRTLALHRLPKKTFLVLWGVALCRLLVPISIPSRFSAYSLVNMLKDKGSGINTPNFVTAIPDIVSQAGRTDNTSSADMTAAAITVSPIIAVWMAGLLGCALFFLVTHLRCRREYRTALPVDSELIRQWLSEHPTRRKIQVRQSDKIAAPLTYGVCHPVVLLPKTTDWTDETRLRYILTHEFVHIRRFDTLTKLLLVSAVCVHWFNPFAWVMYALANRDIELSCDETVVQTFGDTIKSAYALTLIGLEEKKSRLTPLVNNFSKNAIEERIVSIMKIKKTSLTGIILAFVLVAGTVTIFATSAAAAADNSIASGSITINNQNGLISTDNGKTWINEEEFEKAYPTPEVVWWTYDEYKEWLDNEKTLLQSMIGGKGWNPTDGWYIWTQERVDKAVKRYEGLLEDIQNGMKLSKTVDGSNDVVMMSSNPSDIAKSSAYEVVIVNDKGVEAHFGPYDTKEELLAQVRPYCDKQVKAGNMTQMEADGILSKYE